MLLTQILLLKAYFVNVSASIHWYLVENFHNKSDEWKVFIDSIHVNNDLIQEVNHKDQVISELKSRLLISESNEFVKNQLQSIDLNNTNKNNWSLVKTRLCDSDTLYVFTKENPSFKKGALVIHNQGVIGLIANDCLDNYCLVKLINHKDTSIAVNNKNDQISGLMSVNQTNALTLDYVNKKGNLMQNEVLYTAGFTPEQPAGFPVATVNEKFLDFKNQFHYYLSPVESLNCPAWAMVWKA